MSTSSPGWWQDPTGRHEHRYWDGANWSDHVSDRGVTSVDPMIRPPGPGPSRNVVVVAAAVAVVLVVAVVAVTVTHGDGGSSTSPTDGGGGGGPLVEIPVGTADEVAVGAGAVWVLNDTDHMVLRIDPTTDEVTDEVTNEVDINLTGPLAAGDDAVWVGAYPDGRFDENVLLRLDPTTLETVAEVPLPASPDWDAVATGPSGVWIATRGEQVVQIDGATNEIVAEIPVQDGALQLAVGDDAAWVTATGGSTEAVLQRVDAASGEVTTIDLAAEGDVSADQSIVLHRIAATDGAAWVGRYHTSPDRQTVGVDLCRVESESLDVECAELPADSIGSITAGEDAVWVSGGRDDGQAVMRIDPDTLEVTAEVDLPTASVLDMAAGEGAVWVTNRTGEDWSVLKIPT